MSKTVWAVIAVIVLIVLLFSGAGLLFANQSYGYWGMMGGPGMMGWFGFPFMGGLSMLLFWGLVIAGIVWLIQNTRSTGQQPGEGSPSPESPLDILKRRYAAGEITKEQFEEMKRNLAV
jgi:putative membrane protein